MKQNNVIEINGRLYDAKTGAPLEKSKKSTAIVAKAPSTKSVDGFKPNTSTTPKLSPKKIAVATSPNPVKSAIQPVAKKSRTPAAQMHLKTHRSTTLNRSGVSQPDLHTELGPEKIPAHSVSSSSLKQIDSERTNRVAAVQKSPAISRFRTQKKTAQIPTATPAAVHQSKSGQTVATPLTKQLTSTHSGAAPAQSTKERLISQAVAKAALSDAKPQPHKVKKLPLHKRHAHKIHIARYVTSMGVALVLVGYVAYLNIPSVSMKVAAHRAGFAANLPGYKPSGYSLTGPIASSAGQVTVNFSSNTDERRFALKQQPTTWDSAALLENYVTKENPSYLTYQDRGLTIYIYGGSSAAWVNGGKFYHVEGNNSQLDTDQLLKLATSV